MAAKPVVDGIERQHQGELSVIHLNVQDLASQPLMQRFGFEYTPTFILLGPTGELVQKWVGAIDPGQLTQALSGK